MGCTLIVDKWCGFGMRAAAYVGTHWETACDAAGVHVERFPYRVLVDDVDQAHTMRLHRLGYYVSETAS